MATLSTEFDGSNDYVTLGTPAGMAGAPDDASVDKCFSFWFKTTNSAYGRWLISQAEDSTGQYKWGVQNLFGQLRIWCGGGLIDTTGTAYEDGAWHHIAVSVRTVSSVRTVQVWVDGVSEGTNTAYNFASTTADWIVAAVRTTAGGSLQDFLDVKICELTFWSGAVNSAAMGPTEIAELYNGGTTTDPTTHSKAAYLVNYWKGGDGDTHPTWTDSVGSDDGTMVNMSSADFVADAPPSSGGSSYTGNVNETVTLSESLGSVHSAIVGLSETDALSEALAASRGVAATPAETVTLSESLASQFAAVVAAGETVTLSESVLNGSAYTAAPTETVTLSESLAGQLSAIPTPAETVALSESSTASQRHFVFLNEFSTLSESLNAGASSNYTETPSETVSVAESVGAVFATTRSVSETVTASEAVAGAAGYARSLSETVSLAELIGSLSAQATALAESVSVAESVGAIRAALVAIAETATLAESVTGVRGAVASPSETVSVAEAIATLQTATQALAESVSVAEQLAGTRPDLIFSLLLSVRAAAYSVLTSLAENQVDATVAAYSVTTTLQGGTDNMVYVNTRVRLTGTFTTPTGALYDPSTLALSVINDSGSETIYTYPTHIVKDSIGVYHLDVLASVAGNMRYQWRSTATGEEVRSEGHVRVMQTSY